MACRWLLILILSTQHSALSTVHAQLPPRGLAVKVEFAIEPTEITLGEDFTLKLTVRNAFNPQQLTPPDLRKLPEFEKLFQIENVPGDPPKANAPSVKFVYRLRPRESGTIEIPRLAYEYFTPQGKLNTTLTQQGLSITVKPAKVVPPAIVPVEGQERLFDLTRMEELTDLRSPDRFARHFVWLVLLFPLLGLAWYVLWLRLYPDAAAQSKLKQHRAARRALRAIDASERSVDAAHALSAAIRGYLHDRCGLPIEAITPVEVADALARRTPSVSEGVASATALPPVDSTIAFLHRCDAVRFSPTADASLAAEARRLIAAWEAA